MNAFLQGAIVGVFVGGIIGVLATCLCVIDAAARVGRDRALLPPQRKFTAQEMAAFDRAVLLYAPPTPRRA